MSEAVPIVEMRDISKRFAGVQALHMVNLVLRPGEVLGRGQKVADVPVVADLQSFREQVVAAMIGAGPATRTHGHNQLAQERG